MDTLKKAIIQSDDGSLYSVDVISYEDGLWLVPMWLKMPSEGTRRPKRIIRMDTIQHQDRGPSPHDYTVNVAIPKAVLDGVTPPLQCVPFEVVDEPEISLRLSQDLN